MGGKNDNRSRMQGDCAREMLEVLAKEAYEEASITFGPFTFHRLGDRCSLKACGNKNGNILFVLAADFAVAKLNEELENKGQILHLKLQGDKEIQELYWMVTGQDSSNWTVKTKNRTSNFCFRPHLCRWR
jgi:hypothetical protein